MNLLKYLMYLPRWHRLPVIPRMSSVEWKPEDLDADTIALMEATATRCPQGVYLLEKKHHAPAHQLAKTLNPEKRKRQPKTQAGRLWRRLWGAWAYDPMKGIARKERRSAPRKR